MKKTLWMMWICILLAVSGLTACNQKTDQPKPDVEDAETVTLTFVMADGTAVAPITGETGSTVTLPIPVSASGYAFDGWYKDAAHTGEALSGSYRLTVDETLYGAFAEGYTVTFVLPGGEKQSAVYGEGAVIDLSAIEYDTENYECTGWTDGTAQYAPDGKVTVSQAMTLTASFTQYDFRFHLVKGATPADDFYRIDDLNNVRATSLTIPSEFKGLPVKEIYGRAFTAWNGSLRSLTVPDSVEYIGAGAFSGLYHLQTLDLPFVGTQKYVTIPDADGLYPNEGGMFAILFCPPGLMDAAHAQFYRPDTFYYEVDTKGSSLVADVGFTTLYLPESLTDVSIRGGMIPDYAFTNVTTVQTLRFGDDVTSLGVSAVSNMSTMNDELDEFEAELTTVVFGEGSRLTEIGEMAFSRQYNLNSITIPAGVTEIGTGAFYMCGSLQTVPFAVGSVCKKIGTQAFFMSGLKEISLPAGCEELGDSCFADCPLQSIVIPASVTKFGGAVFTSDDSLERVEFAEGSLLTEIPPSTFRECYALSEIVLPPAIDTIGSNAFRSCSLIDSFDFRGIRVLGSGAFAGTGLEEVTLYPTLESFGDSVFLACSALASVDFSRVGGNYEGRVQFGDSVFAECESLNLLTFPDGLTEIGMRAFIGTALTEIVLPASVQTIGQFSFSRCPFLWSVKFAAGSQLKVIVKQAFFWSHMLQEIAFPDGLTEIGDAAFAQCWQLGDVTIPTSVKVMGDGVFASCSGCVVHVPYSLPEVPETWHSDWAGSATPQFTGDIEITPIPGYRYDGFLYGDKYYIAKFTGPRTYRTITLPETIVLTGEAPDDGGEAPVTEYEIVWMAGVFADNDIIREVTLPKNMTRIPVRFFENCDSLQKVIVPEGGVITDIASHAFYDCGLLETFDLDGSALVTVGESAFYGCDLWTHELTLTGELSSLGKSAFYSCPKLTIEFSEDFFLETIPESVFAFSGVRTYDFTGVTEIGAKAFQQTAFVGDDGVLTIPSTVKTIGESAFQSCYGIHVVIVEDGVETIGDRAFFGCNGASSGTFNYFNGKMQYFEYLLIKGTPKSVGTCISEYNYGPDFDDDFGNPYGTAIFLETISVDTDEHDRPLSDPAGFATGWFYVDHNMEYGNHVYPAGTWEYVDGVPTPISA